ncbi:TetR/AcrR family transcriptional regulator [Streptomyces sp. NPDC002845]
MPDKQQTEEQTRQPRPSTDRSGAARSASTPPATDRPTATPPDAPDATPSAEKPRRRQARGERRITQLLEAAASVFSTTGYTAASTNAIAREAGVSPGTLYQFFPNKEAIAIELGTRLLHDMRTTYGEAFAPVDPATPLEEAVGSIVDRFIAFNCQNPALFTLLHGPDLPGRMTEEHDALHAALVSRLQNLLTSLLPSGRPPADVTRVAQMTLGLYKAGLELVLAHEGAEREAYVQELKDVLVRYLEPLIDDRPADRTP